MYEVGEYMKHINLIIHVMLGIAWGLFLSIGYIIANRNLIVMVGLSFIGTVLIFMIHRFIFDYMRYTDVEYVDDTETENCSISPGSNKEL